MNIWLALALTAVNIVFTLIYHFPPARARDVLFNAGLYVWGWRILLLVWLSPSFAIWITFCFGVSALAAVGLAILALILAVGTAFMTRALLLQIRDDGIRSLVKSSRFGLDASIWAALAFGCYLASAKAMAAL